MLRSTSVLLSISSMLYWFPLYCKGNICEKQDSTTCWLPVGVISGWNGWVHCWTNGYARHSWSIFALILDVYMMALFLQWWESFALW
jgi:hypothetical protein